MKLGSSRMSSIKKPGPQAYSRAAHVRWLKGDLAGAIDLMRKAARAGSRRDPEAAAWAFACLARYELQAGRPDRSTACVDAALEPEYAPALLARGRVLLAREQSVVLMQQVLLPSEREHLSRAARALREGTGSTLAIHSLRASNEHRIDRRSHREKNRSRKEAS